MNVARWGQAAVGLSAGERVLVVGGIGGQTSAETLDWRTGRWSVLPLERSRRVPTVTVLHALGDNRALVFGSSMPSDVFSYSTWEPTDTVGSFDPAREWHTATRLNTGQVLVAGGQDVTLPDYIPPGAPRSPLYTPPPQIFGLLISGTRAIQMVWKTPTSSYTGFRVERWVDAGPWTLVGGCDLGPQARECADPAANLTRGKYYSYRVAALGASGTTYSETASIHYDVPAAPSNFVAMVGHLNRVHLTWRDGSGNEEGFRTIRRLPNENPPSQWVTTMNATTQEDQTTSPGENYPTRSLRSMCSVIRRLRWLRRW